LRHGFPEAIHPSSLFSQFFIFDLVDLKEFHHGELKFDLNRPFVHTAAVPGRQSVFHFEIHKERNAHFTVGIPALDASLVKI
jgi:hypothetical protein